MLAGDKQVKGEKDSKRQVGETQAEEVRLWVQTQCVITRTSEPRLTRCRSDQIRSDKIPDLAQRQDLNPLVLVLTN